METIVREMSIGIQDFEKLRTRCCVYERKSKGFPGKASGDSKPQNSLPDTKRKSTNLSEQSVSDDIMPPNNLPDKNNNFTGRVEMLNDIFKAFHTNNEVSLVQSQAITGMGGIGKSETAKEYAYRHHKEYRHI